jgi:sugar-specific transcriptional regulator TrmB
MVMQPFSLLRNLGLSEREATTYLALLEHGPATIAGISRASGLHRPVLYRVLPTLVERGLVAITPKGKQRRYVAESPEKLGALVEKLCTAFTEALPDLQRAYAGNRTRPIVKFLEGRKGLQEVYGDLVRSCKRDDVYYRYSSRRATTNWRRYFPKTYLEERDHKQLQRFVISSAKLDRTFERDMNRAVKVVPPQYGLFEYDVVCLIYANKVAFMDYNTETALIIENPAIAEFQKKLFKLLYDKL